MDNRVIVVLQMAVKYVKFLGYYKEINFQAI
jgi:hypothetical protein